MSPYPTLLIIAGVSGTGKTTVGVELANRFKIPFWDADHFHPPSNIAKMKAGTPLDDADREPWLIEIRSKAIGFLTHSGSSGHINTQTDPQSKTLVVACSSLKRRYRDILRGSLETASPGSPQTKGSTIQVHFIHLQAPPELIEQRIKARKNHFMGVDMLASQFNTLEEPDPEQENTSESKVITLGLLSSTGEPKLPKEIVDEAVRELAIQTQSPLVIAQSPSPCLPRLQDLLHAGSDKLSAVLGLLFEVSGAVEKKLIPALLADPAKNTLDSYDQLVTRCQDLVQNHFSLDDQIDFLASHPRIGQVKNLSKLSSKEQGNQTDPAVLARLEELNKLYEKAYPGLRYVTFVNGRTRAEIAREMEDLLLKDGTPVDDVHRQDRQWHAELGRGVRDVFEIARCRLKGLVNPTPAS